VWRVESALNVDLRDVLGAIRVPTLVINHRDRLGARQSQYLAEHIDGAKSLETPGPDCLPFAGDSVTLLDPVEEFLTGRLPPVQLDRVLATVLFTDIVNSTGMSRSCGCLTAESAAFRFRTHGQAGTKLHQVWGSMIQRCTNPQAHQYPNYGGRGIEVCAA
jgi:hypothetical protein